MIKRIDIKRMGSFVNFQWTGKLGKDAGNNPIECKKLNVLYGRNYSGKTTFSRIVRCLETKVLPEKFDGVDFTIVTEGGNITSSNLTGGPDVRVYNRDFVDQNLAFLRDVNGRILPFAVIGAENTKIQADIAAKEAELGNVESKTGLRYELSQKRTTAKEQRDSVGKLERALGTKLTSKATKAPTGIKHQAIYKDPNYNTPKLEADIATVLGKKTIALAEDVRAAKIALLGEAALPDLLVDYSVDPRLTSLIGKVTIILEKKISPQEPIAELLEDPALQAWVRSGMALHEEKRTTCGFCGSDFKAGFWEKLKAHFDKESQDLLAAIAAVQAEIQAEKIKIETLEQTDPGVFYADFKGQAEGKVRELGIALKAYKKQLDLLAAALQKRSADVFKIVSAPKTTDNCKDLIEGAAAIAELVSKNNARTKNLAADQAATLLELRLSEIAQFVQESGYIKEKAAIDAANECASKAEKDAATLGETVRKLEGELEDLRRKLRDEKRGAEKVNEYLRNFFGHDGLKLVAREIPETPDFTFTIMRGECDAFNLSEGECSLVAFCYFMARLEDVTAVGKELIVYIDDPISSLDSNHIFFIYSLIHSSIEKAEAAGNGWKQIFISTHNLDFLKLLKRLPISAKQQQHFMITATPAGSTIQLMPSYLRNYVTEFNFLFEQICRCASTVGTPDEHHCFYNFGNNMRKFLEAYLFFRYPFATLNSDVDHSDRIGKFFGDQQSDAMVKRLTNEYSHLHGAFDRGMQPIDRAEIGKVADFVLGKIKEKDPDQYESLLKSVGMDDPFAPASPVAVVVPIATAS